jgi:hypothetical protein
VKEGVFLMATGDHGHTILESRMSKSYFVMGQISVFVLFSIVMSLIVFLGEMYQASRVKMLMTGLTWLATLSFMLYLTKFSRQGRWKYLLTPSRIICQQINGKTNLEVKVKQIIRYDLSRSRLEKITGASSLYLLVKGQESQVRIGPLSRIDSVDWMNKLDALTGHTQEHARTPGKITGA